MRRFLPAFADEFYKLTGMERRDLGVGGDCQRPLEFLRSTRCSLLITLIARAFFSQSENPRPVSQLQCEVTQREANVTLHALVSFPILKASRLPCYPRHVGI